MQQKTWWGAKRFVSTGCLVGHEAMPSPSLTAVVRTRQAFDEDTQAQLYMAAHASKTANKQGLGKGKAGGKHLIEPIIYMEPNLASW